MEMIPLLKQCEAEQIKFSIEVLAGPSARVVALKAAESLGATWVILDRKMKRNRKYFMERMSCGLSRMKRDNRIEQLRGPKPIENTKMPSGKSISSPDHVSYDEMIPGNLGKELSPKKSPVTQKSNVSSSSRMNNNEASRKSIKQERGDEKHAMGEEQKQHFFSERNAMGKEEFEDMVCTVCKNRRPKMEWRDFIYMELYEATDRFSRRNFLSEGGFGSVYRGKLMSNGLKIAVKQHKDVSFQGEREFKSEVQVLRKARHPNLVRLLGSCSEGSHRLLVYEYVCNGSLDQHLLNEAVGKQVPLNWQNRIRIALGAARGLKYLHENNIIHRDMRPDNILVTHDYESLLGDFGLARTHCDGSDHSLTGVVGTIGYMAPEYAESGKMSTKTDVYSFGVVLLQLITGLRTTEEMLGGESLVGWARPLLEEKKYPDLIDKRILDSHDVHQLLWMVRVAEKCLCEDPNKRYSMEKVVNSLTCIYEGDTNSIRDFSPLQSDSINRLKD